ncbi:hypothetical protein Salat_2159600 [Sesamum alatum]|uniref:Uncharacterized protein n=1 Tax=Sesamum alatum TaxID=300844 RepID=A0AAE1Y2K7_9LAMI|nr:hypothetical protein Salat_2159600 [Sesamum alatum]
MGPMWVSSMHIGALRVQSRACVKTCTKGLMIVKGLIAGEEVKTVVVTRATHSLISDRIVQELGLDVKPCDSMLKAVNSKADPVSAITTTNLCIRPWKGTCGFVAVRLDDFDVILGNNFFVSAQVTIHPWLDGIYKAKCKRPKFVRGLYGKGDTQVEGKSRTVKLVPSSCISSRDGEHSSHIVRFCCIGKMQEEMKKRWDEA